MHKVLFYIPVNISLSFHLGLRNDLKSVMKEIEEGLYKVHAIAKTHKSNSEGETMDTSIGKSYLPLIKPSIAICCMTRIFFELFLK